MKRKFDGEDDSNFNFEMLQNMHQTGTLQDSTNYINVRHHCILCVKDKDN